MALVNPQATIAYITISLLSFIGLIVIVTGLFLNHKKKKTTGTLLLFVSFVVLALGPFFSNIKNILQIIPSINVETTTILSIFSTIMPLLSLQLIYIFSCRHILKDDDVLKSLTLMLTSALIGFAFTIYFLGALNITVQTNPDTFYYVEYHHITGDILNISNTLLSILSVLLQIYIILRISIRSFILSNRTDKFVRKKGLRLIAWGLLTYLIGGFVIVLEVVPVYPTLVFPMIFWSLRKMVFFASYVLLYLGFVMPERFRRQIRGKSWFEQQYSSVSRKKS